MAETKGPLPEPELPAHLDWRRLRLTDEEHAEFVEEFDPSGIPAGNPDVNTS